jgi:hypothetical protein
MSVKAKKQTTNEGCNCLEQVQEYLKPDNTQLRQDLMFSMKSMSAARSTRVFVETRKIDTKIKKAKKEVFAAYCPFCGKKYPA